MEKQTGILGFVFWCCLHICVCVLPVSVSAAIAQLQQFL